MCSQRSARFRSPITSTGGSRWQRWPPTTRPRTWPRPGRCERSIPSCSSSATARRSAARARRWTRRSAAPRLTRCRASDSMRRPSSPPRPSWPTPRAWQALSLARLAAASRRAPAVAVCARRRAGDLRTRLAARGARELAAALQAAAAGRARSRCAARGRRRLSGVCPRPPGNLRGDAAAPPEAEPDAARGVRARRRRRCRGAGGGAAAATSCTTRTPSTRSASCARRCTVSSRSSARAASRCRSIWRRATGASSRCSTTD